MPFFIILIIITVSLYIVPMMVIWAINYLFGTIIEYTIWTWCAVIVLLAVLRGKVEFSFKKS